VQDSESIYRQFVQFEEKAASIYLQLASRFSDDPQLSSFWLDMAMAEKQHAGLLQFCLCQDLFAKALPDATQNQKLVVFLDTLEKRAADPEITIQQAFSLALQLEASEINAIYCNLTTPLHASTYLLRRKIATSLPNHLGELTDAARRFGIEESALQELDQAKERCSSHWQPPK
jgi:rubrerythrin